MEKRPAASKPGPTQNPPAVRRDTSHCENLLFDRFPYSRPVLTNTVNKPGAMEEDLASWPEVGCPALHIRDLPRRRLGFK